MLSLGHGFSKGQRPICCHRYTAGMMRLCAQGLQSPTFINQWIMASSLNWGRSILRWKMHRNSARRSSPQRRTCPWKSSMVRFRALGFCSSEIRMFGFKRLRGHPCRAAFLGLQGFTGFGVGTCRCLYVVGKICSTVPCVDLFPTVVQWNRVEGSWARPISL